MDMRALYYVSLPQPNEGAMDAQRYDEQVKANENYLNQNMTILAQAIVELNRRINSITQPTN